MDNGEYQQISQQISDLKELIEEKFAQNEKAHGDINNWLCTLNDRITKQEQWKNQQIPILDRWKQEEQRRVGKEWDLTIKLIGGTIVGIILSIITMILKTHL